MVPAIERNELIEQWAEEEREPFAGWSRVRGPQASII